jgi:hypothetical protein
MTHAKLKRLAKSDPQAAIDYVRSASVEFMMEVARDESYTLQLRGEAVKAALPIVHGPPPGGPVEDESDPRVVELLSAFGISGRH